MDRQQSMPELYTNRQKATLYATSQAWSLRVWFPQQAKPVAGNLFDGQHLTEPYKISLYHESSVGLKLQIP